MKNRIVSFCKSLLTKLFLLLVLTLAKSLSAKSQLTVEAGATLVIDSTASIVVSGDVISNSKIDGAGVLVMQSNTKQTLSMNGNVISNLEVDNIDSEIVITSPLIIERSLGFTNGKIRIGNQDLILEANASISGYGNDKFIWTDGTGRLIRKITSYVNNLEFPVGYNTSYHPAFITAYADAFNNAQIGIKSVEGIEPSSPKVIANSLRTYWSITRTGMTGGVTYITAQYIDTVDVIGKETELSGYYFDGTEWSSAGEYHDYTNNTIYTTLTSDTGSLYAMNKFILVGAKAFLQGAYNPVTGLMNDALRTAPNLIPLSDPYRNSPYNTNFVHINNPIVETVDPSVFLDKDSIQNNIVDWVFLELRNLNNSPGNIVLQTRSALLQRDGDIVDIDGVSPVAFNSPSGSYIITVRHRNHLGLSFDPLTSPSYFTETKSLAFNRYAADLRTVTDVQLFGNTDAYTTSSHPTLGTVNLLWGGNANGNNSIRYTGPSNDLGYLLTNTLGGNNSTVLNSVYSGADLNLNRNVRYTGPSNDHGFLITNVLNGNTSTIITQQFPQ